MHFFFCTCKNNNYYCKNSVAFMKISSDLLSQLVVFQENGYLLLLLSLFGYIIDGIVVRTYLNYGIFPIKTIKWLDSLLQIFNSLLKFCCISAYCCISGPFLQKTVTWSNYKCIMIALLNPLFSAVKITFM